MGIQRYIDAWTPGRSINDPVSILSERTDGFGFYYGHLPGTCLQVNVRYERPEAGEPAVFGRWVAYGDGIRVGDYDTKAQAEANAITFLLERKA
jgi:hypothetical protein